MCIKGLSFNFNIVFDKISTYFVSWFRALRHP